MQRRSTQGVVFVHACPKALCQHVEWALERVVGAPVSLSWAEQPAAHGSYRAEVAWTGSPGTGAKLAAALKAWPMLRFEVTEEASHGNDGERDEIVENIHWRVALLPFVASCGDNGVLERPPHEIHETLHQCAAHSQ